MMRWRAVLVLALMWVMSAATAAPAGWFGFEMNPAALSGAPDVSALNRPLDAASRIVVRDGHFHRVGADGQPGTGDDTRVRFFGVNLTFGANFPDSIEAATLARQLRKLGFNAVRLHHLDSLPSDYPDAPISILTTGPFPTFSPTAVARLRGLIEALAREGIYVNLNLHVGYRFRPRVDGLPALDGGADMPPLTAPIHVYDPRLIAMQEDYARRLIQALGLKDNPALAMVELNNESSLLAAWLGPDWLAAIPSAYAPELRKQWRAWLMQRHGSLAQACAAWGGCAGGNDNAVEFPVPGQQQPLYESGLAQLRSGIARRVSAWFGSDAKVDLRERDFLLFLAATDQAYFERLRRVVHESTDARVPVTGTQMGYGGLLNFDSQVAMDYIDEHFYVGHPDIRANDDWRIPDLTASGNEFGRVLALSLRRDARRPFVVSEFNQPFPNPRGAEILPLMSAVGALQDWDGLFYFDYSDAQRLPQSPSRFALSGDLGAHGAGGPERFAVPPAAAGRAARRDRLADGSAAAPAAGRRPALRCDHHRPGRRPGRKAAMGIAGPGGVGPGRGARHGAAGSAERDALAEPRRVGGPHRDRRAGPVGRVRRHRQRPYRRPVGLDAVRRGGRGQRHAYAAGRPATGAVAAYAAGPGQRHHRHAAGLDAGPAQDAGALSWPGRLVHAGAGRRFGRPVGRLRHPAAGLAAPHAGAAGAGAARRPAVGLSAGWRRPPPGRVAGRRGELGRRRRARAGAGPR